jgi:hypothetical protein
MTDNRPLGLLGGEPPPLAGLLNSAPSAQGRAARARTLADLRGWPDLGYGIDPPSVDNMIPDRFGLQAPAPLTPGYFYRNIAPGWVAPMTDPTSTYVRNRDLRRGLPPEEFSDTPWYPGGITPWGALPQVSRGF